MALKVERHAGLSTQGRRCFQREADALRRLEHPGITRIYDHGAFEGGGGPRPYLALVVPVITRLGLRLRR